MIRKTLTVLSFAAVVVFASGCRNHKNIEHAAQIGQFKGDTDPRAIHDFTRIQAANGARDDGMLRDHHFAGTRLNSLGRAKVDLMLGDLDDSADAIDLWLNLDEAADTTAGRREAVVAYLNAKGVTGNAVRLSVGPNPNAWKPAASGIAGLKKTAGGEAGTSTAGAEGGEGGTESMINATPMK
jgi:hypothetical protein